MCFDSFDDDRDDEKERDSGTLYDAVDSNSGVVVVSECFIVESVVLEPVVWECFDGGVCGEFGGSGGCLIVEYVVAVFE